MRNTLLLVLLFAAACARQSSDPSSEREGVAAAHPSKPPRLEKLWTTEGFDAPEGVALAADGAFFISNVGGEDTDGDGFISKLGADGTLLVERFADGADGPKGMAVIDGVLYVCDIVRVRTYDASTGETGPVIDIPDARYLNDATVWNGDVFVSDSGTGRIWRLTDEGPTLWREGDELNGVNGLLGAGDKMFISTMASGALFEADANGGWREIANGMIDADGIGIVPEAAGGGYLVSSWPGEIHYVSQDGETSILVDTRAEGVLQNDLTVFGDIVIVPNWEPGAVTAWRINPAD